MLVLNYVLTLKKDSESLRVTDLIVNLGDEGKLFSDALSSAWFIGRADGAPFSKIILSDHSDNEYMLPLHLETEESERKVERFFQTTRLLKVCSIATVADERIETRRLPLLAFESEQAAIMQSMKAQVG